MPLKEERPLATAGNGLRATHAALRLSKNANAGPSLAEPLEARANGRPRQV